MLLGHWSFLLISTNVVQHLTPLINQENFLRNKSTHYHENCTLSNMAHHWKLQKNLTKSQIYNYTVAMISVMLRSLHRFVMQYSVITIFNFVVMVTINWLNYFFKSIFNHLISLNLAVRIVFQFRKRCTLPTCAMGHHACDCWRRLSADRFSSECNVYAVWTALRKFSLRIELVMSISFLSFVKYMLSIKLN